jgi:excisionase family DNA binding protein
MILNFKKTWLSLSEIAQHLGLAEATIHRMLRANDIPAYKIGKLWKFNADEVDHYMMQNKRYGKRFNDSENKDDI